MVNGLRARGYETAIFHTGRHEVDAIPEDVEHIHADPFDERSSLRDFSCPMHVAQCRVGLPTREV